MGQSVREDKNVLLIYCIIFIDMVATGITIPMLPFYVTSLGKGPEVYGFLETCFQAAQFIGSLLLGSLSDSLGSKNVILKRTFSKKNYKKNN